MKIACCLFKYFPYSGLARDFATIATELVSRGHVVIAYVHDWEGDELSGVQTVRLGHKFGTNHHRVWRYAQELKKRIEADPVDVTLGFNKMPGLDWYYVADVCYVGKVDGEKHGITKFLYTKMPRYRTFSQFERAVFSPESQTRILFIDKVQKGQFERYYPEAVQRSTVLPPSVGDSALYSSFSADQIANKRASDGLREDSIQLIQVGSDFARKGLDRSIRAVAAMPPELRRRISLKVIGQDDSSRFIALAKACGVESAVTFCGGIPNSGLDMVAADIFIHPAYTENTGTVIVEAVTAATPQIVTRNCGYAHYVEEAGSGIVINEPFVQAELNDAVYRLTMDRMLRRTLAHKAKSFTDNHLEMLNSMPRNVADMLEGKVGFYHSLN